MEPRTSVLLAGATGLVGRHCLERLLQDEAIAQVVVPTRRTLPRDLYGEGDASKLEERVIDFRRLGAYDELGRVDAVICALGTTIKQAGSKEAFREVDCGYPVTLAELAQEGGAKRYALVSAIGANPSSMFFYNRVKGEVEMRLRAFDFENLTIVRPSLLLGDRDEFRPGEEIAKRVSPLIPRRYKPVHARQVARALVAAVKGERTGVEIIESRDLQQFE